MPRYLSSLFLTLLTLWRGTENLFLWLGRTVTLLKRD